MKHTLPRLFIQGIASVCITAANTLQQLHVTGINFTSWTISIGKIALKTKTIIVMLLIVINKLYSFCKYNMSKGQKKGQRCKVSFN
jgi:hypothetical protein